MTEIDSAASRRAQVIAAATQVFLRYGYARTTMADIAKSAGLTRPTLYLTFPDKERIFEAVVRTMVDEKLAQIRMDLRSEKSLEAKLRAACDAWASDGYELVRAHPDAADMFDLGFEAVCAGYGEFGRLLEELLTEPLAKSALNLSPQTLSRIIVYSLRGFKDTATDGVDMRSLIAVYVMLVSASLAKS